MQLKPGYKQTELGVIPQEWECARISTVAVLESGHTPSKREPSYWNGSIPWVSLFDTQGLQGCEIFETAKMITEEGLNNSSARLLPKGTVVFSRTATVGKTTVMGREMATSQDFANYICGPKLHNHYLVYLFRNMGRTWKSLMAGSIHNTIYMPVFKALQIVLPPLPEQRAIATALSDVDELLGGLDRLIAKKRDLKQAAMQQLLTGQTRLPGFNGKWEIKTLRSIVQTPVTDGPHLTPQFLDDGIPFLSVNNLVENKIDLKELRFISRADHELFSRKCRPLKNDILLGKAASVGKVALVNLEIEFNIWSPIAMIRTNRENAPSFVYFQLQSADLIRQITLLTNSSSQGNIGMGDIEKLALKLPPVSEQEAIAEVLTDMDAELAALEQRREKTRSVKQGMMQELLTGRTRLV